MYTYIYIYIPGSTGERFFFGRFLFLGWDQKSPKSRISRIRSNLWKPCRNHMFIMTVRIHRFQMVHFAQNLINFDGLFPGPSMVFPNQPFNPCSCEYRRLPLQLSLDLRDSLDMVGSGKNQKESQPWPHHMSLFLTLGCSIMMLPHIKSTSQVPLKYSLMGGPCIHPTAKQGGPSYEVLSHGTTKC